MITNQKSSSSHANSIRAKKGSMIDAHNKTGDYQLTVTPASKAKDAPPLRKGISGAARGEPNGAK